MLWWGLSLKLFNLKTEKSITHKNELFRIKTYNNNKYNYLKILFYVTSIKKTQMKF